MGTLVFQATLGGSVNLIGPNTASTVNFTLPSADGSSGQALTTNGSGTLSFTTVTATPGGSTTQVQYNSSGAFAGSANLTFNGTTLTAANTSITTSETLSYGTANGVTYLNGSKVLTSGSALTFDGTNLGLGVTPNAWSVLGSGLQLKGGGSVVGRTDTVTQTNYTLNGYFDGTNWKYLESTYATRYMQYVGGHSWHIAPAGTAGNTISFTQAMTLDATGALLINPTSNDNAANRLYIQGYQGYASSATDLATSATKASARIRGSNDSSQSAFMGAMANGEGQYLQVANVSGTSSYDFAINPYGGNFMVGKGAINETSNGFEVLAGAEFRATNSSAPAGRMYRRSANGDTLVFYRDLTLVGSVSVTTTATTYNTSSDYRLKNITGALTGYKERLMSLLPKQGTWIADGSDFRGFVAHDFANPYPNSVTGEKDAVDADGNPVMQSMQASSSEVMADLVAMIQEQQAIIQQLQADVAALKGN